MREKGKIYKEIIVNSEPVVIAVEGVDGVGKDTFIDKAMAFLKEEGIKSCKINAITDGLLGKRIRATLKSKLNELPDNLILASAFMAETTNASDQIYKLVNYKGRPNLDVIFLNRWIYSTFAYNTDTEKERKELYKIMENINSIIYPDYVVHLDLPINQIIERLGKRTGKDFEAFEEEEKLIKVRKNYEKIFSRPDSYLINNGRYNLFPHKSQKEKINYKKFETHNIDNNLIREILEWINVL